MKHGLLRVAAATPSIQVADPTYNAGQIINAVLQAPEGTALLVFPELCLTGYTCGDLFLQDTLLRGAEKALQTVLAATAERDTVLVVGLPIRVGGALYNAAAVCLRGTLLGLVPKSHIPNYSEFYEARHFTSGMTVNQPVEIAGQTAVLRADQVFACRQLPAFCVGVEICEDMWVGDSPAIRLTAGGATVIANPSASDESIGKPAYRRALVTGQSAKLCCGYVYADAGEGESTSDLVFSGHNLVAENGVVLAESERFTTGVTAVSEIDLQHLAYDRRRMNTFATESAPATVWFDMPVRETPLSRTIAPLPFVPAGDAVRRERCEEILHIQAAGLAARLQHTHSDAVIGLSGGLDSALALLVALRAFDALGADRTRIHVVTMPCFGTTDRTLHNARTLATASGASLQEIGVGVSVTLHLETIGHAGAHDVTYENAQARERTQVLMDIANMCGGLVIGTGDLSELALGWATYNGDHMSMYGVNASVPKTLVRYLVAYEADRIGGAVGDALRDILATPVSPELLPPENGVISQKTEDLVGPYELHDFFLYHMVRFGSSPAKIYRLCRYAFGDRYDDATVKKWLKVFVRRFFAQQFKRNCLPDGPRVGSVAFSPRGDWRMPADASAALWLAEIETL